MNKIKILCALSLILTVSACSSSGGGGSKGGGSVPFALSNAPGPSGSAIEDSTLVRNIEAALDRLETETMAGGSLTALGADALPATAILNGYLRVIGRNSDEIIVGNLELDVDFTTGTVDTFATGFREFRISDDNPPELLDGDNTISDLSSLTGSGSITTGTLSLVGLLGLRSSDDRLMRIDSTLTPRGFYEEGGKLVTYGGVVGSAEIMIGESPPGPTLENVFTSGDFAASTSE